MGSLAVPLADSVTGVTSGGGSRAMLDHANAPFIASQTAFSLRAFAHRNTRYFGGRTLVREGELSGSVVTNFARRQRDSGVAAHDGERRLDN
jgi:hypothetical protein